MARRVIGLTYMSGYNALHGLALWYAKLLHDKGFETEVLNLATPGTMEALEESLRSNEVLFCFAPQGIGSRLGNDKQTIWEKFRVPFVGVHIDNPCYNIYNHFSNTRYVADLYVYESFADIHRRYLQTDQIVETMPYQLSDIGASQIPFRDRPIKLLYLKTGESVDECVQKLNGLPAPLRDGIWQQLERAAQNPNFQVCDLVQELFDRFGVDRNENTANFDLFWGCAHWMDMYLRRKRAADFVNWVKMQDGAVIVGNGWDFIDRTGARAVFRPSVPAEDVRKLYWQSRFIGNTNPYGRDVVHERVFFGLLNQSLVVSDTDAWLENYRNAPLDEYGENIALKLFDWARPLDDQLQDFLKMPVPDGEATVFIGRWHACAHFTGYDIASKILNCAARVDPERMT